MIYCLNLKPENRLHEKILGLDLGTTSIGWAIVNEAEKENEKSSIVRTGVRIIQYDSFVSSSHRFEKMTIAAATCQLQVKNTILKWRDSGIHEHNQKNNKDVNKAIYNKVAVIN